MLTPNSAIPCQSPAVNPDLWFSERRKDVDAARSMCQACPVRTHCLRLALETNEQHGMWGALTSEERKGLSAATYPAPTRDERRAVA